MKVLSAIVWWTGLCSIVTSLLVVALAVRVWARRTAAAARQCVSFRDELRDHVEDRAAMADRREHIAEFADVDGPVLVAASFYECEDILSLGSWEPQRRFLA